MFAEIAAAKREVMNEIKRALAQLFVYSLTAKGSALGDGDQVESSDDAKAPGAASSESKPQRQPVRIQPFGFRSVQPKGIRGLTLRLGGSNLFFIGIGPTTAYGPQDLGVGDAALHSSGAAELRAKGDDLIANGGTKKVALVGDQVLVGTLAGSTPVGGGAVTFVFTPTNADGTPGTTVSGPTATIAAVIANAAGSPHFKG